MINSKELRIGNFVTDEFGTEALYVYRLWQNGAELTTNDEGSDDLDYAEEDIYGIKLEPQLLEQYGFEKEQNLPKSYHWGYKKPDGDLDPKWTFRIWKYGEDICIEPFGEDKGHIGIEYLHQLQNIYFALLGRELSNIKTQENG